MARAAGTLTVVAGLGSVSKSAVPRKRRQRLGRIRVRHVSGGGAQLRSTRTIAPESWQSVCGCIRSTSLVKCTQSGELQQSAVCRLVLSHLWRTWNRTE